MKAKLFAILFLTLLSLNIRAEEPAKMQWWRDARFGLFIHWGPYAVFGGEYNGYLQRAGGSEWIMNRCKIPVAEYQQAAARFNPTEFDADAIVRMAKNAGMKYIIFTAKHHDGFAMFKSDASNFNIVDFTPYGKDVVAQLAQACRRHGLKLGLYYSQAQDWNNPGGATHRRPMAQGWPNPAADSVDRYTAEHRGSWDPAQQTRSYSEYIDSVAVPQVREILSNYGDIAVIWWDTPAGSAAEAAKLQAVADEYPYLIANDRLSRIDSVARPDYKTPEQTIPSVRDLDGSYWETCMTLNNSWGFLRRGNVWKSSETIIRNLIDILSKGGNFLLNIGPDELGRISESAQLRLAEIGRWVNKYAEAVYGTERVKIRKPEFGYCTQKVGDGHSSIYLYVTEWPDDGKLLFRYYTAPAVKAVSLADGAVLTFTNTHDGILINVPAEAPDLPASVIRLDFDSELPRIPYTDVGGKSFDILY